MSPSFTRSQNVFVCSVVSVDDIVKFGRKGTRKRNLCYIELRSFAAVVFLKKIASFPRAIARRGPRANGEGSVSEWKRDLSSSDCHGQEVMGNRVRFLGAWGFRSCRRARAPARNAECSLFTERYPGRGRMQPAGAAAGLMVAVISYNF